MSHYPMSGSMVEIVADRVKHYPYGACRKDIARDFEISKSTAKEHLEKAVQRGLLRKFYGWINRNYHGWIYIDPGAAPNPMYAEVLDEPEWKSEAFQDRTVDYDRGTPYAIPANDDLSKLDDDDLAWHIQTELELGHELPPDLK
jgi:hypothetical protein